MFLLSASVAVAAAPDTTPALGAIYTGSSGCRDCHPKFYELWETSHHGRAMQPIAAVLARGDLLPHEAPLAVGPHTYRMRIEGNAARMTEEGPGGSKSYPVLYTLGGKNVFYFLTLLDGGRLQVMPLAYDVVLKKWIDTTGSMVRHAGGVRDEALDWRERPLTFNTSCFDCHVSQLSRGYNAESNTYSTTWNEPGINCEVCHGPGSEHARIFREAQEKKQPPPKELRLIRMKNLTPPQRNDTCAPCHAKMRPLTAGFVPGQRFFDHYDLVTFEHADYHPDGRDLGENYTMTSWLMNVCNRDGKLDCIHCHTSSGRNRFTGEQANHACLPCHKARVEDAPAHTHHPAGSPGNRCVSCHMPTTVFAQMRRSDHSFRPPAPAATVAFGSPNACTICHTNATPQWADAKVRSWRTRDYQAPILELGRMMQAARSNDWTKLDSMLEYLTRSNREQVVSASLLRLFAGCPDPRTGPAARGRMASDASPLVRGAAADLLAYRRDEPANRDALLAGCRDDYRLVRVRSAIALSGAPLDGIAPEARTAFDKALAEYRASLDCRPDEWSSHYNLGNLHLDTGAPALAIPAFQTAVRLAPEQLMPWVNGAMAHARSGNMAASETWLRSALQRDPTNAVACFNLGLAVAERGDLAEAEKLLRQAVKSDPRMAEAAFNLGVLLGRRDAGAGADWTAKAAALRPGDGRYAYTHAFYLHRAGRADEARVVLEALMATAPVNPDAAILLGGIHEAAGRREEARRAYERALESPALTVEAARDLRRRIRALP